MRQLILKRKWAADIARVRAEDAFLGPPAISHSYIELPVSITGQMCR
jgi:hypothetical protein